MDSVSNDFSNLIPLGMDYVQTTAEAPAVEAGVEETLDVIELVCKLVQASIKSAETKKISIADFLSALASVPKALIGMDNIPTEIKNLGPVGIAAIESFIVKEFDLVDNTVSVINRAVDVVVSIYNLIKVIQDLKTVPAVKVTEPQVAIDAKTV